MKHRLNRRLLVLARWADAPPAEDVDLRASRTSLGATSFLKAAVSQNQSQESKMVPASGIKNESQGAKIVNQIISSTSYSAPLSDVSELQKLQQQVVQESIDAMTSIMKSDESSVASSKAEDTEDHSEGDEYDDKADSTFKEVAEVKYGVDGDFVEKMEEN